MKKVLIILALAGVCYVAFGQKKQSQTSGDPNQDLGVDFDPNEGNFIGSPSGNAGVVYQGKLWYVENGQVWSEYINANPTAVKNELSQAEFDSYPVGGTLMAGLIFKA